MSGLGDLFNFTPGPQRRTVYGIEERDPYESELQYFGQNRHVGGMAAEDNRVIINPYTTLDDPQRNAVRMNEAARVHMRQGKLTPNFALTPEQQGLLQSFGYGQAPEQDQRATIAARMLSGDNSAGQPTPDQLDFVRQLRLLMGIK